MDKNNLINQIKYENHGAQGLIINRDNQQILLAKRPDYWVIPGGKIEERESPEEATIRELKEETGLDVAIINKLGDYFRPDLKKFGKVGDRTEVFLCKLLGGYFMKNPEIEAIGWWSLDSLPNIAPWHYQRIYDAFSFNGTPFSRIQDFK